MAEIALNALNLLANMLKLAGRFDAGNIASALTETQHAEGVEMAEKACRIYHISRQGQPCNRGVLA